MVNGKTQSVRHLLFTIYHLPVALAIAITSACIVFWQNSRLAVLWDLSYILENSYRISLGDVPYRDFPFPYPPLTFLTQAALIKLTGREFLHHVIYCAIVGACATLLTWRILLFLLRQTTTTQAGLLSLLLAAPLTVLGIYAIYPHPFYDPDCTFMVLASVLLFLTWSVRPSPALGILTGATFVLPVLIKQNTGLAFLISALGSLTVVLVLDIWQRRPVGKYFWLFAGTIAMLAVAVLLIHFTAGLENYVRWTVRFAAERRTPAFRDMLAVYQDSLLKWWVLLFVAGGLLLRYSQRKLLAGLAVVLMTAPFLWSVIYLFKDADASERAERLIGLWPFVVIISVVAFAINIRRSAGPDSFLPLILIGTVHGAFLSQQLWGSTYAIWPLFLILVATPVAGILRFAREPAEFSALLFALLCAVSLLVAGGFYLKSNERLDYADITDGDLTHSHLLELKGLTTRGSWIPDFEELVDYAQKNIPMDDGILFVPGEDLFYYTSGRRPRFPVLMFDHTVNPYTSQEIVSLARDRGITWLIVKDELQMEEEPVEHKDELLKLLDQDFESVESLNNYEIYKRKSPDSEDDESTDDDDSKGGEAHR